jgi:hypothetical protein
MPYSSDLTDGVSRTLRTVRAKDPSDVAPAPPCAPPWGRFLSIRPRADERSSQCTTAGILTRLDSAVPPGTDIVILKVRANDQVLYHISSDVSAANVRTIVERLRAKRAEVYLLGHDTQRGIRDRADLHVESSRPAFNYHLGAGRRLPVTGGHFGAIGTAPLRPALGCCVRPSAGDSRSPGPCNMPRREGSGLACPAACCRCSEHAGVHGVGLQREASGDSASRGPGSPSRRSVTWGRGLSA